MMTALRPLFRCACERQLRVSGSGRHRIYFEIDASLGHPVMDGACPGCRAPLPGKQGLSDPVRSR